MDLSQLISSGDQVVYRSTVSRFLKKRASVWVREQKTASKYSNDGKERRAKLNSLKVYRLLKSSVKLIMNDERWFTRTGDIAETRSYYTFDPSTTPPEIKFKQLMEYEPTLLFSWTVSAKDRSSMYVYKSKISVRADLYLIQCVKKRLLPFVNKHHRDFDVRLAFGETFPSLTRATIPGLPSVLNLPSPIAERRYAEAQQLIL